MMSGTAIGKTLWSQQTERWGGGVAATLCMQNDYQLHTVILSWSIPNAESQSLTSPIPWPGVLLWPCLRSLKLHRSLLITPNWILWTSPCCIPIYGLNASQNVPGQPWGCCGLPRSCGHHMTIMQSCTTHATSSVGHLAGPGTWGSQPSLFPIYFDLVAC